MLDDASELTARMLEGIVEEQGEDSEDAVRYLVSQPSHLIHKGCEQRN